MEDREQRFNDMIGSIWNLFDDCCNDDMGTLPSVENDDDIKWRLHQAYNASLLHFRISNTPKLDPTVKRLALQWTSQLLPVVLFDTYSDALISTLNEFHLQVRAAVKRSQHPPVDWHALRGGS